MTSSRRFARALALAASVALIMAGLALQPVAAISNGSSLAWLAEAAHDRGHRRDDHKRRSEIRTALRSRSRSSTGPAIA